MTRAGSGHSVRGIRAEKAMARWADLLDDARPIRAIFGNALPSLRGVDLHEVVVSWDGPSVSLRLDAAEFPASPPAEWAELNTVQLTLVAWGVETMSMSDVIPRTDPVDLDIHRGPVPASQTLRNEGVDHVSGRPMSAPPRWLVHVRVVAGSGPILKLTAHSLYLEEITAYLSAARPEP